MSTANNPPRGSDGALTSSVRIRLSQLWSQVTQRGQAIDLAALVPAGPNVPALLVQELLKADMEIRSQRGVPFQLPVYQTQFPRLFGICPINAELVLHEYQLRQFSPNPPALAEYQRAYPQFAEKLASLCNSVTRNAATLQTNPGSGSTPSSMHNSPTLAPTGSGTRPALSETPAQPSGMASLSAHYQMIRRLGAGAYGEVWLAEAPGGVEVAVKKIFRSVDQEEGQRELQVLKLIKGLRHPFLLQTQAYWREHDRLFIVMDLADGSLRDRLKEHKAQGHMGIPEDELLLYFRETAEALDFLHSQKLHHRDVKPENILVLKGHAKVADFGLTKELQGDEVAQATFCGSPVYMAPETWNQSLSPNSDQYSLALTYVELRLGKLPFTAKSMHELMMMHLNGQMFSLDPLPAAEQTALRKALDPEPGKRYPSCKVFVEALTRAVRPQSVSMTAIEVPSLPPRPPRSKWPWVVVAVIMVALGLGGGYLAHRHFGQTQELPSPWLPEGFHGVSDDIDRSVASQPLHRMIAKKVGDQTFEFMLIPSEPGKGLPRFYMMRDKVSNAQFLLAAEDGDFRKALEELEKGQPQPLKGDRSGHWRALAQNPRWPVRSVTVTEAHCFARWLGGYLPTAPQWERAAGADDGDPGPFEKGWQPPKQMAPDNPDVAVGGRSEPMPVGEAKKDVSRYGCRDMAGNGMEWTSTLSLLKAVNVTFPLSDPISSDRVEVRGQSFTKNVPLIFEMEKRVTYPYLTHQEDLSFRVALPIPPP